MNFRPLLLFFILLFQFKALAQSDSVSLSPGGRMQDGIYLSYDDFRHNQAITKEQIISKQDKKQLEFISRALSQEKFSYQSYGIAVTAESNKVWGYFQNNTFYINMKNEFYRVPVFGSISYLVANVKVVNSGFADPRFGYPAGSTTTTELREFLMNFYDGEIVDFSFERAETLIGRDKALYQEFKKLSRRKQKQQLYRYIRRYNDLHPVYFLKS